jgi:hypothetical protein
VNRKKFLFTFAQNKNLHLNSLELAVTAVNTREVHTAGANAHTTFGRENQTGSTLGEFDKRLRDSTVTYLRAF